MNTDRQPYYFLLIFLSAIILSCDEKLTEIQNEEVSIVGTWHLNGYSGTSFTSYTEDGMPVTIESVYEGVKYNSTFTFFQNPNSIKVEGEFTINVITNFNYGGSLFTTEDEFSSTQDIGVATWSLQDNILTISDPNSDPSEVEYLIIKLDSENLTLQFSYEISDNSSGKSVV